MTAPRLLLLALVAATAAPSAVRAQAAACQIARAELAAFDRDAARLAARARRVADIEKLAAYYHAAGCGTSLPLFGRAPPQCGQIEQRIAAAQAEVARGPSSEGGLRARLAAAADRACAGREPAESVASSRMIFDPAGGGSSVIVDGAEQPQTPQTPLGRAICVRSCDGYYFPLASAPGGREGADEMCQALCPAAETRAYFLDKGSIDSAANAEGKRYASLPAAYRFKKSISASCQCRQAGQTWSSALQRAEEMVPPAAGDVTVTEQNQPSNLALRPSAGAEAPAPKPRSPQDQAIDPEPIDLEPEILPPEPSGVAVMRAAPTAPSPATDDEAARANGSKKPARIVGPATTFDGGKPPPAARPSAH